MLASKAAWSITWVTWTFLLREKNKANKSLLVVFILDTFFPIWNKQQNKCNIFHSYPCTKRIRCIQFVNTSYLYPWTDQMIVDAPWWKSHQYWFEQLYTTFSSSYSDHCFCQKLFMLLHSFQQKEDSNHFHFFSLHSQDIKLHNYNSVFASISGLQ